MSSMLFRVIVLLILLWLLGRVFDRLRGTGQRPDHQKRAKANSGIALVRCSVCGVHIPQNRTLPTPDGLRACSEDCLRRSQSVATG